MAQRKKLPSAGVRFYAGGEATLLEDQNFDIQMDPEIN